MIQDSEENEESQEEQQPPPTLTDSGQRKEESGITDAGKDLRRLSGSELATFQRTTGQTTVKSKATFGLDRSGGLFDQMN